MSAASHGVARHSGSGADRSRPLASRARFACVVLACATACTFEGYVPKDPPPKPLAESEAHIEDLAVGASVKGDLDCPAGRCRVRYRIVVPASGELVVTVDGPAGEGDEGDVGPRLARAVLEGVGQQSLATRLRGEGPPPFEVRSQVERGVHYVLIQGLGGPLDYTVTSRFSPSGEPIVEAGSLQDIPDPPPGPKRSQRVLDSTVVPLPEGVPGGVSPAAQFVSDPNIDVASLRTYAFAQDPAAMLEGEPGSVKGNVFLLKAIQRQIRYTLADQGKQMVAPDQAQFLVAVGVGKQSTTWWTWSWGVLDQSYAYYLNNWGYPVGSQPLTYQDGTLVIDFVDPKQHTLLWHGWATEPIPISGDQDEVIKTVVHEVLKQL